MPLWLSFALIGIGILAIGIEIFVPAAGLIGLAGGGSIVAGVVLGFVEHDAMTGSIVLFTALLATPTAVVIGLRAFPKTRVGRRLILGPIDDGDTASGTRDGNGAAAGADARPADGARGERAATGERGATGARGDAAGERSAAAGERGAAAGGVAPGDEGEALTVLRPSGTALVGGRRLSVVTSGEWVERGARLRVVRVEGSRVVVRAAVELTGS